MASPCGPARSSEGGRYAGHRCTGLWGGDEQVLNPRPHLARVLRVLAAVNVPGVAMATERRPVHAHHLREARSTWRLVLRLPLLLLHLRCAERALAGSRRLPPRLSGTSWSGVHDLRSRASGLR